MLIKHYWGVYTYLLLKIQVISTVREFYRREGLQLNLDLGNNPSAFDS